MPLEGFFNRSSIDEVRTSTMVWTGDEHFAAKVRYSPAWTGNIAAAQQPTEQADGAAFVCTENGSAGDSETTMIVTEQIIDETGSAGTDNTHNADGDGGLQPDLGKFITEMNKSTGLIGNVEMVATNAPHDLDLESATAIVNQTATQLPLDGRWIDCLNLDGSVTDEAFLRIGYPEVQDSGRIMVLRITGKLTYASTVGTVKLYRDPFNDADTAPTLLVDLGTPGATTVQTTYWDYNKMEAPVFRGPLLLGVEGFADPAGISFEVTWMPVEW